MRELPKIHRKLILVCTNVREDGTECCAQKGSIELHKKLKAAMKEADISIRVSKSGCLDRCSTGATVVIQPDDIWLGNVTEADIPEIVKLATGR